MARQAIWVHGNTVAMQYPGGAGGIPSPYTGGSQMDQVFDGGQQRAWTDIVGMPTGIGKVFQGKAGNSNWFHGVVPTPVWRDGVNAKVLMIGILFDSAPGVELDQISAFDGPNPFPLPMPAALNLSGQHLSLEGNVNRFDFSGPDIHDITIALGLSFHFRFNVDGHITFAAIGGDFQLVA